MSGEQPAQLPADPVRAGTEQAIRWHEVMSDYEAAGFTHAEAFALTKSQHREYWAVLYEMSFADQADE